MDVKEIHELINMKARRLEIEMVLGISNIDKSHLSKSQVDHITHEKRYNQNPFTMLNHLNNAIKTDEWIIKNRH
ncbi:MAG: hypothetical protein JEZ08_01715 [Clostridiales bacterium]|nr:hypothetical protein [Clostridiales bacterium]